MTVPPDLDLGDGYVICGDTLRGTVVDATRFRSAHADDPACDLLVAAGEGRLHDALTEADRLLAADPSSVRLRALRADVLRDRGRLVEAERTYRALDRETAAEPGRNATIRQHLGKVLLAAGRDAEALAVFEQVLADRQADGADDGMLASTRQAIARARSPEGRAD